MRFRRPFLGGMILALAMVSIAFAIHPLDFDFDNDDDVDRDDLAAIINQWLQTGTKIADLNHDQVVNSKDAGILLSHWGPLKQEKYNVVLILTDDQRADTMTSEYMPNVTTLLVNEGVKFTNAFATTPLCCPSRASILSGLYAHNHNVLRNGKPNGGAGNFDDDSTIATWLKSAGYRTALFGKYLNGYSTLDPWPYVPPGWDEWAAFSDKGEEDGFYFNYKMLEKSGENPPGEITYEGEDYYSTTVIGKKARDFIKSTPTDKPFFLYLSTSAPHTPSLPAPSDEFAPVNLPPQAPSFNEDNVSDKPAWVQALPPAGEHRELTKDKLRTLLEVDRTIKVVVDTLAETPGRLDKTVIIFLSDNGQAQGEHRHTGKDCLYEECIKLPFVVRMPGIPPRTDDHLVANIDLAPTISELATIAPGHPTNGKSLVPLLNNPSTAWRTEILLEAIGWDSAEKDQEFQAVRDANFIYGEYANPPTNDRELYDLRVDPYQLESKHNDADYAGEKTRLKTLLDALKGS